MKHKQVIYHHINVTNKTEELKYLTELQNEGFVIIGIELVDSELALKCLLSIDPQHTASNSDITSIEYVFNYQKDILPIISNFDKIAICITRPDVDSIGSTALLTLLINNKFILDGDIILRLKAIAKSDRHGRKDWKKKFEDHFKFPNHNVYGLPSGLAYMTSDRKLSIEQKIHNMIKYLTSGSFKTIEAYNNKINRNFKKSSKHTNLNIIIPNKLSFVISKYRGAISFGYRYTPVVIARNDYYIFGQNASEKVGKKITIAQYEDNKYIDLNGLCERLNKLETSWGGSSAIIGSPIDGPTRLTDHVIINLTKEYLY